MARALLEQQWIFRNSLRSRWRAGGLLVVREALFSCLLPRSSGAYCRRLVSGLISIGVSAVACYRLSATPLWGMMLGLLAASVVLTIAAWAWTVRGGQVPRLLTALIHVVTSLSLFFLFVSFAVH